MSRKRRERGKRRDADTNHSYIKPSVPALPYRNNASMVVFFDLLTLVSGAPDRTDSTAGRSRPAPWNPRSGFQGEGANQGDVSRPERSGGRVTATEKKLIARSRLSPTKEVTGGRRATTAQEILRTSSGQITNLRMRGEGPPFLKFPRRVLYDVKDFEVWLDRHKQKTAEG